VTGVFAALWRFRRVLYASTRAELRKRYAGSILGPLWPVLYPLLFLGAYLFLWLVVFNLRFPGMGQLGYVVYVFGGLVPFLFLSEALTASAVSIKQNMQLIKSVIVPPELVPVRAVFVALSSHLVGLALVLLLSGINGTLSWRWLLLPGVVCVYVAGLVGAAWIAAWIGVLVPDFVQLLNIVLVLLMFVSPIAFTPQMVPARFSFTLRLNPVSYIADVYRGVLISEHGTGLPSVAAFAIASVGVCAAGAILCARFKSRVVDLE
jgi:lipopolysaccharide transport system permease protein